MSSVASRPGTFESYLKLYGPTLGRKAVNTLDPLHVHGRDPAPDFSYIAEFNDRRVPFDAQAHIIAGASKMLTTNGNGFICGEMGTGKTLMGMLAIHEHAKGQPYRSLVLCPDHLISTWEQEIQETIPGAIIHRFENWKAMIALFSAGHQRRTVTRAQQSEVAREEHVSDGVGSVEHIQSTRNPDSGKLIRIRKRWKKAEGPEWFILGRDQAKHDPKKRGIGSEHRGFGGDMASNRSTAHRIVAHEPMTDADERLICDPVTGDQIMKAIIDRRVICPSCGMQILGVKNSAMSVSDVNDRMPTCKGHFLEGVARQIEGADGKLRYPDGKNRLPGNEEHRKKLGKVVRIGVYDYLVRPCEEKLWNFTRKPYRYAPAAIIQRKLRGLFEYLVIDEVHEQKSDESARSMAAGKLMGVAKHVLALTGTLIGGYANHLFPLLLRMTPKTIRRENFEWAKDLDWSQVYGRVDRVVTTKQSAGEVAHVRGQTTMRKARTGKSKEDSIVRPGVMPTLYGRHMIGNTIFIQLAELAEELPDMNEYVGGKLMGEDDVREQKVDESAEDYAAFAASERMRYEEYKAGWFETAVDMDDECAEEYRRIEQDLSAANTALLQRGSMKLLGTTLWTTMDWPDQPYDWRGEHPDRHTIGYYEIPGIKTTENFVGVVTPVDMDRDIIRPKEQALIDICLKQKEEGRQSWVYVNMTGRRNIQGRLASLLTAVGLKVCVLKKGDAKPIDRKDWIEKNGPKYDVILSNPVLVSTGLTLFRKKDDVVYHNFSTLIFYETGYSLFTLRQAARRAWRIGQPVNCRVYYLYYKHTMQHRAMALMSRKMAAATALEGEFSVEGLVALGGDDNAQMALARSLKDSISDEDTQRGWSKLKGRTKPKKPELAAARSAVMDMLTGQDEAEEAADRMLLIGQMLIDNGSTQQEIDMSLALCRGTEREESQVRKPRTRTKQESRQPEPVAVVAETIEEIKARYMPSIGAPKLVVANTPAADEPYKLPDLSRAQLAAMFANMQANGMTLEDFN